MYAEGYKNITSVDFSEIVVEDMQLQYKNNAYQDSLQCKPALTQSSSLTSGTSRSSRTRPSTAWSTRACSTPSWYTSLYPVRDLLETELEEDAAGGFAGAEEQGGLHLRLVRGPGHPQPLLRGQGGEVRLGEEEPVALQDLQTHHRPQRARGGLQRQGQGEEQGLLPLHLHPRQGNPSPTQGEDNLIGPVEGQSKSSAAVINSANLTK